MTCCVSYDSVSYSRESSPSIDLLCKLWQCILFYRIVTEYRPVVSVMTVYLILENRHWVQTCCVSYDSVSYNTELSPSIDLLCQLRQCIIKRVFNEFLLFEWFMTVYHILESFQWVLTFCISLDNLIKLRPIYRFIQSFHVGSNNTSFYFLFRWHFWSTNQNFDSIIERKKKLKILKRSSEQ